MEEYLLRSNSKLDLYYSTIYDIEILNNGKCIYSGEMITVIHKLKKDIDEMSRIIKDANAALKQSSDRREIHIYIHHREQKTKADVYEQDVNNIISHLRLINSPVYKIIINKSLFSSIA